jgi:enoyl-CoA hydratase/carnithine racemase
VSESPDGASDLLLTEDAGRVRTLTLNRPEALNAFNEALYDATADALISAADDDEVAVVVLTGNGRAFSAGTDLHELSARAADPGAFPAGRHGFTGLIDVLVDFPKPFIVAVNGVGLGIGVTVLGFADLAFMSATARLKCPFTSLGVSPEAASSYLLPELIGRQNAAWVLLSSEWIDAPTALGMGLVWKVCEPDDLLPDALDHAQRLAQHPLNSLQAVKRTMVDRHRDQIRSALATEHATFAQLLGGAANSSALEHFASGH